MERRAGEIDRTQQIVQLSEFLDRHRGRLLTLPGVTGVGVGPRTLADIGSDMVVQIFVRSNEEAGVVRERAASMLEPQQVEVFVRGQVEPRRG